MSDGVSDSKPGHSWQRAAAFAAIKHAGQTRKDNRTPYVSHVFRVALTVREVFGCEDAHAMTAALLHDTIEDTDTDYDDVSTRFGREVAELVVAVTKNMMLPDAEREADYDARLAAADWRARLIKLADVYDNLTDMAGLSKAAQGRTIDRSYRALSLAAADASDHPEMRAGIEHVERLLRALGHERE
ncbi:MAG: HD domain-containing protein [Planctomycetota bacterium]